MSEHTGYPGAPRGGTRTRPVAPGNAGGTATPGARRPCSPSTRRRRRGPAPATPGSGVPVAPWAVAVGAADHPHTTRPGRARAAACTSGADRRGSAGRVLHRQPRQQRVNGRSVAVHRPPAPGRLARRQNDITPPPYHGPALTRQPPRQARHRGRGRRRLRVAAPGGSAGRSLGIPSRQSPAWGVGSWFVPIVRLWVPYSAVRDCLPPGHPHRPRVLHWWIAWLGAGVLRRALGVCALFSTGGALVVAIPMHAVPRDHRLGARASCWPSRPRTGTRLTRETDCHWGDAVTCLEVCCGERARKTNPSVAQHSAVTFALLLPCV